jgi:glycine/sarcosine N-methyltransferase
MEPESQAFYRALADRYDELFVEDPETTRALASELAPGARVLDLACGTGAYSTALAARGLAVTGIDLSAELVERGRRRGGRASLLVGDMRGFAQIAPGPFDRIMCIGNSLPHLADEAEVAALLRQARAALAPGGSLIVQTVNFDRGPALTELPALRAGAVSMRRRYRWEGDRVLFVATLDEPGARPRTAAVPLLALRSERLAALAQAAGFARAALAAGFDRRPHQSDGFLTVLFAET